VANPLSRRILAGEFAEGESALVDYVNGDYAFEQKQASAEPAAEEAAARAG